MATSRHRVFIGRDILKVERKFIFVEPLPKLPETIFKLTQSNVEWSVIVSVFLKWYRLQQASAKSDIDKPTSIIIGKAHEQRKVVCARYGSAVCTHYGCRDTPDVNANLRQNPAEKSILLVTPATASCIDDLVIGVLYFGRQSIAKLNIEIFERDAVNVSTQKSAQRVESWFCRTRPSDSFKIVSEMHAANYAVAATYDPNIPIANNRCCLKSAIVCN